MKEQLPTRFRGTMSVEEWCKLPGVKVTQQMLDTLIRMVNAGKLWSEQHYHVEGM